MSNTVTVVQVVLGFLFTLGGLFKFIIPYPRYAKLTGWATDFKPGHVHLLGVLEMGGGIGLIIPLLMPSLTVLATLAGVGMALYMSGAIATHLRRSEYLHMAGILIFFLAPTLFVAYGKLVGIAV